MEYIPSVLIYISIGVFIMKATVTMISSDEYDDQCDPSVTNGSTPVNTSTKINCWYRNYSKTVVIYPHLEFERLYSYSQLMEIANDIKQTLFQDSMEIYEKNAYCFELNGNWNVCFGVKDINGITYTYMLRRDYRLNKSYACPFVNTEYRNDLQHTVFNKETYLKKFTRLEDFLKTKYSGNHIHYFHMELP